MPPASDRQVNRIGHLVAQVPEAGGRVEADHPLRRSAAHGHKIEVSGRRSVGDTEDAARQLDQLTAIPQPVQVLPASAARDQLRGR
jgi:hypothetical protein